MLNDHYISFVIFSTVVIFLGYMLHIWNENHD
jgi:hypothetical protein